LNFHNFRVGEDEAGKDAEADPYGSMQADTTSRRRS